MKKIFSICLIVICALMTIACGSKSNETANSGEQDYALDKVANYYKKYTKKLDKAQGTEEVDRVTQEAIKDYQKMVADNEVKFINLLMSSANGSISADDPRLKDVEEAWKECNLMLSEKTMGKYDYMPDFNDMYSLLYDKLPSELKETQTAPNDYTFGQQNAEEKAHKEEFQFYR